MNKVKLKKIYQNPNTGVATHWVRGAGQAGRVLKWLEARGVDYEREIRGFKWKRGGGFSFRHGVGYDWLSSDLLCGSADGRARREFEDETGLCFTLV